MKFPGTPPSNLGVSRDGRLAPCSASPNCVSSQATDKRHAIDPIAFTGSPKKAMSTLRSILNEMPRTAIIRQSKDYIQAECASRLLGFTDDMEFYCEAARKVIHVRSASRLGYSDLGVNRKRIEAIRKAFSRRMG